MLFLFWCNILLIPLMYVGSSPQNEHVHNKTAAANEVVKQSQNKTNFALVSEGGSLLPDNSLTLPKEYEILSNLDEELGTKKEKPIARRNGVGLPTDGNNTVSHDLADLQAKVTPTEPVKNGSYAVNMLKNTTAVNHGTPSQKQSNNNGKNVPHTIKTTVQNNKTIIKLDDKNKTLKQNETMGLNKTEIHKPYVLSYEALSNAVDTNPVTLSAMNPSLKTIMNDQIPSPNKDKVLLLGSQKHPGMIMPLVITILVVPMFAVLGFMALRRGREAWKNRHYKRMDFLLDGMYND